MSFSRMIELIQNKDKGYNEIADECYQQLKLGDTIAIQGILNNKGEIEIQDEIEII